MVLPEIYLSVKTSCGDHIRALREHEFTIHGAIAKQLTCAVRKSSREIRGSLEDDDWNWMSSSISSRELNEVSGDDVTDVISFSLLWRHDWSFRSRIQKQAHLGSGYCSLLILLQKSSMMTRSGTLYRLPLISTSSRTSFSVIAADCGCIISILPLFH